MHQPGWVAQGAAGLVLFAGLVLGLRSDSWARGWWVVFWVSRFVAPPIALVWLIYWVRTTRASPEAGAAGLGGVAAVAVACHLAGRFYRDRITVIRSRRDLKQRVAKIRAEG